MIKHLALAVLTAASLVSTPGVASAQPWGWGYFGYRDPSYYRDRPYYSYRDPYYRHRYRERHYYGGDRYYRERDYRERRGYRTQSGCRPGFTVQDGVCKPYRGY